jgi:predicted signal transduction protein with EAL and GGDEF domain
MRNADMALYRAKATGGAAFAYDEACAPAPKPAWQEECAAPAIEQIRTLLSARGRCGQRAIGRFRGAAALEQPELGRVSPDRFLSLAEETRLSLPIGHGC